MRRVFILVLVVLSAGCDKEFEPDLSGWKASNFPKRRLDLDLNGRVKSVDLVGGENVTYRYAQWVRSMDRMLMVQFREVATCNDYMIVEADTTGMITDTVFVAPPATAINFRLAPNDSLLLIKSYVDNCTESKGYQYSFYNRFTKQSLPDTIEVEDARGILLRETVWSPDSKRVIIQDKAVGGLKAFVYDLQTRQRIPIDIGVNFLWSPTDNNLLAYIKENSIYVWHVDTQESELFFPGKSVKGVSEFRWNPNGDFMKLIVKGYLLNMELAPFQTTRTMYLSMKDKSVSRVFYEADRLDTWKEGR